MRTLVLPLDRAQALAGVLRSLGLLEPTTALELEQDAAGPGLETRTLHLYDHDDETVALTLFPDLTFTVEPTPEPGSALASTIGAIGAVLDSYRTKWGITEGWWLPELERPRRAGRPSSLSRPAR